jgi:small-conductance mechanosensitive channel
MKKARKILMEAVLKDPRVDQEPIPTIIIREFRESGVLLEIRFWMKELFNSEIILSDIRFKILEDFRKNHVEIPYPHQVFLNTEKLMTK